MGFAGDGAAGVIRHLIVAFLQHAAPDRAEVTLIGEFATLAPSAIEVPAVKAIPDWENGFWVTSRLSLSDRTRTLDEHEVPDSLRSRSGPAEPLSALLVVATTRARCSPARAPPLARRRSAAPRYRGCVPWTVACLGHGDRRRRWCGTKRHRRPDGFSPSPRGFYTLAPSAAASSLP